MHCKGDFSANKGVADRIAVQDQIHELVKTRERADIRYLILGQVQVCELFQFAQGREILDPVIAHR